MRVFDHQAPHAITSHRRRGSTQTDQARSRTIDNHGRPRIVCMTARLDVTPKTTKQNRIVRTGKSEAQVTNTEKKLRSRYCTMEQRN